MESTQANMMSILFSVRRFSWHEAPVRLQQLSWKKTYLLRPLAQTNAKLNTNLAAFI